MMNQGRLEYLAERLEKIGGGESLEAAKLVRQVIQAGPDVWEQPEAAHALFLAVGQHLCNALDHDDFDESHFYEVDALEAEMGGRVHFFRLTRGWLMRSPGAPTEFPHITDLL